MPHTAIYAGTHILHNPLFDKPIVASERSGNHAIPDNAIMCNREYIVKRREALYSETLCEANDIAFPRRLATLEQALFF